MVSPTSSETRELHLNLSICHEIQLPILISSTQVKLKRSPVEVALQVGEREFIWVMQKLPSPVVTSVLTPLLAQEPLHAP